MSKIKLLNQRPSLLCTYKNGTYTVELYSDGTKIFNDNNSGEFRADFPDSIDLKITNQCQEPLCEWCHECSSPCGKHGDLNHSILDTLHSGTELAIGGGNILLHPDLDNFLQRMKDKGIICNLTINSKHITDEVIDRINYWHRKSLVYGIGISMPEKIDPTFISKLYNNIPKNNYIVLHTILGINDYNIFINEIDEKLRKNIKLLILGYKKIRNGLKYFSENSKVEEQIKNSTDLIKSFIYPNKPQFNVVSFDNLAVEQLHLKDYFTKELGETKFFNEHYTGEDGTNTMYIDLPNLSFARSSTTPINLRYKLETVNNIEEAFNKIRKLLTIFAYS